MTDAADGAEGAADLRAAGDRIEHLLDRLQADLEPGAWLAVEEVVRRVTDLYGAGLERTLDLADEVLGDEPAGEQLFERLFTDDLVASLLIVHGLHPNELARRVEEALDRVRPYLASHGGGVELLGLDEEGGILRLRLLGSCDGCPSSSATLRDAVENAIHEAAPEIVTIDTQGGVEPDLPGPVAVPLGRKPERQPA
ncbi:MAG: NifU family protein [Acidimicrobiales bacterium]